MSPSNIKPPKGDTYIELPDGFEAAASTRHAWDVFFGVTAFVTVLAAAFTTLSERPDRLRVLTVLMAVLVAWGTIRQAGRVRISLHDGRLRIFTGVGPIGWRRSYDWSQFRAVEEIYVAGRHGGYRLVLSGGTNVRFGSLLEYEHREFIQRVLRRELEKTRTKTRV